MNTILLYGGGIDSSALLHYLARERGYKHIVEKKLHALFVSYGQKAEKLEYEACSYFCLSLGVPLIHVRAPFEQLTESAIMHGGSLANDPSINILDGRNFALISLAGMYAAKVGATEIAMGYHVEPVARPFPDASIEFVHAMNRMIPFAFKHQFKITAPFADMTREEIYHYAKVHCPEVLEVAHTCYEAVRGGCGQCSHCLLKTALLENI